MSNNYMESFFPEYEHELVLFCFRNNFYTLLLEIILIFYIGTRRKISNF